MLKLSSLCPKVCCWLYGVRLGYGLWIGFGWVEEIERTDNSAS